MLTVKPSVLCPNTAALASILWADVFLPEANSTAVDSTCDFVRDREQLNERDGD